MTDTEQEYQSYNSLFYISRGPQGASLYISDYIDKPSLYYPVYELFRTCQPHQVIHLYLNTGGGRVDTALQMITAMLECQGNIICHMDQQVASAATYLALFCHTWVVGPFAMMMCHNYSGGYIGKGNEIQAEYEFSKPWLDNLNRTVYEGFLTSKEIERMLRGEDFHFDAEQITERLDKFTAHKEKIMKKIIKGSQ